MAKVVYENPVTPAGYVAALLAHNVELPLLPSSEELGVLRDARGREVMTIDVNGERPDEEVFAVVAYLCMAINQVGGFKAISATADDEEPVT